MTRKFNGWRVFLTASLLWLSVFGGLAFWESGRQVTGLAALESAGRFSLYWPSLCCGGWPFEPGHGGEGARAKAAMIRAGWNIRTRRAEGAERGAALDA